MDNGKISLRQSKRLLFFNILSLGLLFLPDALAVQTGKDGGVAILIALLLALLYVGVLVRFMDKKRKDGTLEAAGGMVSKILYGIYGIYFIVLGGYGSFLLADMVRTFLLEGESFWLIAMLIVLLALYSRKTGLEGPARTFEILFWPTIFLLVILLVLGLEELRVTNITPMCAAMQNMGNATGIAFFTFSVAQMIFFLPASLEEGVMLKQLKKGVQGVLLFAGVLLIILYEMLLGSFGRPALADAKIPIMIFSSNLVLPGGFLRRQEALVAGVCFVGILALAGSCIQYGQHCFGRIKQSRCHAWLVAFAVFLLCLWEYYHTGETVELQKFLLVITPFVIFLPFLILGLPKKNGQKQPVLALLLCLSLLFTGCSLEELEDKSFPMAIALKAEGKKCMLNYKYMDLSQVSENQKTKLGSDEIQVEAATLLGAMSEMEHKNGKTMDLNHAKVLLLERSYLEDDKLVWQLIREGNRGAVLSGNLMVLGTEDIDAITDLQKDMDGDIGNYLEELVNGNPSYKNVERFALKSWTSDYYQGNYLSVLPRIEVEHDLPVVGGYYGYLRDTETGESKLYELDLLEGMCAGVCEGGMQQIDLPMGGGIVRVENLRVSYEFSRSNSKVLCHLTMYGDINKDKSIYRPEKKEVEEYLCSIIRNAWGNDGSHTKRAGAGIDLTNSYAHLNCHDRDIYRDYVDDYHSYLRDLQLQIDADLAEF